MGLVAAGSWRGCDKCCGLPYSLVQKPNGDSGHRVPSHVRHPYANASIFKTRVDKLIDVDYVMHGHVLGTSTFTTFLHKSEGVFQGRLQDDHHIGNVRQVL